MPAVVEWGLREYTDSLAAMRALVRARRDGEVEDTLILVEHPPVVTVGVEGDDGSAAASGLPVISVERGGRATFHGPGQLVGYPIVDLSARGRDVRRFVHEVEELMVRSLTPFGVTSGHVHGRRGVWVDGERKIGSVGIAVDHWVTLHGFALNVDPELAAFERFHPCGFSGSVMTSLAHELGRPVRVSEVVPHTVAAWRELFAAPVESPIPSPEMVSPSPGPA
ncbi:MAG TPA: lipoyl(octanoyl) transferase LipB [Thermoplasmata archaeon]|nr:lipoyl(octanoyl) transferase LipB [Thermoplasmata archaeon]